VKDVQLLALVLMDALHLDVEERRRVHSNAGALPDHPAQRFFVRPLDPAPVFLEGRVLGEGLQLAQLSFEVSKPPLPDLGRDEPRQAQVAEGRSSASASLRWSR